MYNTISTSRGDLSLQYYLDYQKLICCQCKCQCSFYFSRAVNSKINILFRNCLKNSRTKYFHGTGGPSIFYISKLQACYVKHCKLMAASFLSLLFLNFNLETTCLVQQLFSCDLLMEFLFLLFVSK